jgi:hypothetical protein
VAGLALLFTAWVVMAGLFGPQTPTNALPQVFYVLLWVELVAVSLLVGPVWRVLSPGHQPRRWRMQSRNRPVSRHRKVIRDRHGLPRSWRLICLSQK